MCGLSLVLMGDGNDWHYISRIRYPKLPLFLGEQVSYSPSSGAVIAIISPDPKSEPAISIPYISTLIPRGIHGDRKRPDKPITSPSRKTKPGIPLRQNEDLDRKFL